MTRNNRLFKFHYFYPCCFECPHKKKIEDLDQVFEVAVAQVYAWISARIRKKSSTTSQNLIFVSKSKCLKLSLILKLKADRALYVLRFNERAAPAKGAFFLHTSRYRRLLPRSELCGRGGGLL